MDTPDQLDAKAPQAPRRLTEGIDMPNAALPEPFHGSAKYLPDIDLTRTAELVESCRAHAASIAELAGVTSKVLDQCYEYEENEPHLAQCCRLVQEVLEQTESALATLGVISHDVEPRAYAEKVAKACGLRWRSVTYAMHVVRTTSSILENFEGNGHDQVLLALHDLESGIEGLIDALKAMIPDSTSSHSIDALLSAPVAAADVEHVEASSEACDCLGSEAITAECSPQDPSTPAQQIERERVELLQVQAMLKCLYQVLLYADDDDSLMHADVASVCARLINDSVCRLDEVVMRGAERRGSHASSNSDPSEHAAQKNDSLGS